MIRFEQVEKRFGEKQVLAHVNWEIEEGERWQLAGPSGIGKTTLLRLLMGLERADGGRILGTGGLRFCPVFQQDRLVEIWNAVENVALVCDDAARARRLLGELLPQDALRQPVRTLSGGMRRRVALARALAAPGDVLVLDEPFAGLDARTAERAADVLEAHCGRRTIILVSHGTETRFSKWKSLCLDEKSGIIGR